MSSSLRPACIIALAILLGFGLLATAHHAALQNDRVAAYGPTNLLVLDKRTGRVSKPHIIQEGLYDDLVPK